MAENIQLNVGVGGDLLAADDIGGVKHQRVKLQIGANGSATDVDTQNPIPTQGAGRQPDGDVVLFAADGSAFATAAPLGSGANYTSSWVDSDGWKVIELVVSADVASAAGGLVIEFTDDVQGSQTVRVSRSYTFSDSDVSSGSLILKLGTLLDGFRVRYTNGGSAQSTFFLEATLRTADTAATAESLESEIDSGTVASISRALLIGKQPDGDYVNSKADGAAFVTTTTLGSGANYTSAWTDSDGWLTIEVVLTSDVISAVDGILLEFTDDVQGSQTVRATKKYTFTAADVTTGFLIIETGTLLDGFRIRYTNGGTAQSTFYLETTLRTQQSSSTALNLESQIDPNTVASLQRSVLIGKDSAGNYRNIGVTDSAGLLTSDFLTEVVRGNITGYSVVSKFGRNSDINTTTLPEDVWLNGGLYTGQPDHADAAETIELLSDNTNDTAAGTGARTVRVVGLDENWNQAEENISTNGTNPASTSSLWRRVFRAFVTQAGPTGSNQGTITIRHTTTSANVFVTIEPNDNQTAVAAYTVPANKTAYMTSLYVPLGRNNGANGSAVVNLLVREENGVYRAVRSYTATQAIPVDPPFHIPLTIPAKADILVRVPNVSDNNSQVSAEFELFLVDN